MQQTTFLVSGAITKMIVLTSWGERFVIEVDQNDKLDHFADKLWDKTLIHSSAHVYHFDEESFELVKYSSKTVGEVFRDSTVIQLVRNDYYETKTNLLIDAVLHRIVNHVRVLLEEDVPFDWWLSQSSIGSPPITEMLVGLGSDTSKLNFFAFFKEVDDCADLLICSGVSHNRVVPTTGNIRPLVCAIIETGTYLCDDNIAIVRYTEGGMSDLIASIDIGTSVDVNPNSFYSHNEQP